MGRKKIITEARKMLGLERITPSKRIQVLKKAGDLIVDIDKEQAKIFYKEALELERKKEQKQKNLQERWKRKTSKERELELQRDKEKLSKSALKMRRYRLNKQRKREELMESLKKPGKKRAKQK